MDPYDEFLKGLAEMPRQTAIEPLWQHPKAGRTLSCLLRYQGPLYGGEAQILCDDELLIARRFDAKDLAVQWAEEERKALLRR